MFISEKFSRNTPEYYRYMYLDKYSPEQIMYVARQKFYKECVECVDNQNKIDIIKIVSEVRIR